MALDAVVRGLLGGGDLVGRAGRILCGLLLGLVGVVVVRLRLLLVVCGCLLLGGGVVEVLLGGVQCGCGGVGLGLCFGHVGRGCLRDGLIGFHWCSAVPAAMLSWACVIA